MSLSRCYGSCPSYTVSVFDDGSLVYEGRDYVRVVGERRARLGDDTMQKIVDLFFNARVFELADRYEYPVTDCASADLTFQYGGRKKTVHHYPVGFGTPIELDELEWAFDALVDSGRWIGRDAMGAHLGRGRGFENALVGRVASIGERIAITVNEASSEKIAAGDRLFVARSGFESGPHWRMATVEAVQVARHTVVIRIESLEPEAEIKVGDQVYARRK